MPEGPLGFPRFSSFGPLTRASEKDLRKSWSSCPPEGRPQEICREIKFTVLTVLEDEGFFSMCNTLEDINSGSCHNIAGKVKQELPYVTQLKTVGGDHGWIMYNGVHYDAEAPSGVDNLRDLPFFFRVNPQDIVINANALNREENFETLEDIIVEVE